MTANPYDVIEKKPKGTWDVNCGSSLIKYAPFDDPGSYDVHEKIEDKWRIVEHSEGLGYVATSMSLKNPEKYPNLRIKVNLGSSNAQTGTTNRIKSFFKSLKDYSLCTKLELSECQITDYTCRKYVEPMLQYNQSIKYLDVSSNIFTDAGAKGIFTSVMESNVSDLRIHKNDITHDCMGVAAQLVSAEKLESFDISYTLVGAEGIKLLSSSLKSTRTLKKFSVENCKIGDEGCLIFAGIFKENGLRNLESLNLANNHFGRVGVEKLVENFIPGMNYSLKDLNLSFNYMGDEGFDFIIGMMKKNIILRKLKIERIGMTYPAFEKFCEKMIVRYDQELGPYPDLNVLYIGDNGLGDEMGPLFKMLEKKNCRIEELDFKKNEVTDYGAKLLNEWLKRFDCNRKKDEFKKKSNEHVDEEVSEEHNGANLERKNFLKFGLKSNAIKEDGAEKLAEIIDSNKIFRELDIRKNKIGVKGAIFFKKALRKRQFKESITPFILNILPRDVGIEGVNHLGIAMRENPKTLNTFFEESKCSYKRHPDLQMLWDRANRKINSNESGTEVNVRSNLHSVRKDIFDGLLEKADEKYTDYRWHGATLVTKYIQYDTPKIDSSNIEESSRHKYGVVVAGLNDERENVWEFLTHCTYHSYGVLENDRGILKWHPWVWYYVKKGWGSVVGNTLYRYGVIIRLQYNRRSEEYIRDLYFKRYGKNQNNLATLRKINHMERAEIIRTMVAEDMKNFWETLMYQTCTESEGLTMFEYVLKYASSPVIDCIRQFLNVFPSEAYGRKDSKYPAVFLEQFIAQSGQTYRDLCLKSTDRFVRRYAEAKKLFLFRFMEIEPLYVSKFIRLSKVEDLLLTEEYADEDRFFVMRRIASSSAQEDEKLATNEFSAHRSFQGKNGKYLEFKEKTTYDTIENLILKNENQSLDKEFTPQISLLHHARQKLSDDKLVPGFSKIFKTTLRQVLDNESLAGGRDLSRAQIMLKMIANSLYHFNCRDWASKLESSELCPEVSVARVHGNVKPRNIILRNSDEMPDLYKGIGYIPGKWVLSDFSRSTEHSKDYIPIKNSAYNPPEVAKRCMTSKEGHYTGKIAASEKIDVWQFGCILFEVLSGTTLFKMEGNNDLLVDESERGELVNWLSIDEERSSLILNQLRANRDVEGYRNSYVSTSLNNWGAYDDETIETMIESGKQLVAMCLQGRPEDRPTFYEILSHPFLRNVDHGKYKIEKGFDFLVPTSKTEWSNSKFLSNQPHLHLVNTDFELANSFVKSMEQQLSEVGCRVTTDAVKHVSVEEYDEEMKRNVTSARVIACFLTKDAFWKPNVVKQLLFADDYRKKSEKKHARVLLININDCTDLSELGNAWDIDEFRNKWVLSDRFQYLVKALASENLSLSKYSLKDVNYDDPASAWNKFLSVQFRSMILSYWRDLIKYNRHSFFKKSMLDRMLTDGHLVATSNIKKYSAESLNNTNFIDSKNLLNKKLGDRKDKFMNLYFLPSHKKRKSPPRVYILCNRNEEEDVQAVAQLSRALELSSSDNKVDKVDLHKNKTDPRNRIINKVKTSHNIKKDSYFKVGRKPPFYRRVKDNVMNVEREDGSLLVLIYATSGVFRRYSTFLHEAVEKRANEFGYILVKGYGFDPSVPSVIDEINEYVPESLQSNFRNSDLYIPYFKADKYPWQYEAVMANLLKKAKHKIDHPNPIEDFTHINVSNKTFI